MDFFKDILKTAGIDPKRTCSTCKHSAKGWGQEPCKTCVKKGSYAMWEAK